MGCNTPSRLDPADQHTFAAALERARAVNRQTPQPLPDSDVVEQCPRSVGDRG